MTTYQTLSLMVCAGTLVLGLVGVTVSIVNLTKKK